MEAPPRLYQARQEFLIICNCNLAATRLRKTNTFVCKPFVNDASVEGCGQLWHKVNLHSFSADVCLADLETLLCHWGRPQK